MGVVRAQEFSGELLFPLSQKHNHAPGIVELPDGSLLASWYRGSGERKADDVAVWGARMERNASEWSTPFLMADRPGFPDCNTCMMLDRHERLWLFWPTIIANTWESCLTNYRVSSQYMDGGCPQWDTSDLILLKPDDFSGPALAQLKTLENEIGEGLSEAYRDEIATLKQRLPDKMYQRMGWQPRCKPTVLKSGRILLPLYTDTFSISIMAISDDDGKSWYASKPLIGFGAIQPSVLQREDGTLVAYMRDNGPLNKIQVCESADDGRTWGAVYPSDLPNPGSGLDGVRLASGEWLLVHNDTTSGRNRLAVSLSADEGKSWQWKKYLEEQSVGSYHYPVVIQAKDGAIHVIYSYFVEAGKSMKHVRFSADWVKSPVTR